MLARGTFGNLVKFSLDSELTPREHYTVAVTGRGTVGLERPCPWPNVRNQSMYIGKIRRSCVVGC